MSPHVTIIIPTRDRCETLPFAIQSCLTQNFERFSVIVSDNMSRDRTREIVAAIDDDRLSYINPGRRLSMSGNFNFALGHAQGDGYVTCIGDDDALVPGALRAFAAIQESHPKLPVSCASVYYGWPRLPQANIANRLYVDVSPERVQVRDAKLVIQRRVAFQDAQEGYVWGLPGVYRGFVPLEIVRRGMRDGQYIHSVTPDAYSAFLTSLLAGHYVHTNRPMFIEGVSAKSNGASQQLFSDPHEEVKYLAENDIPIHSSLVYCSAPSVVMTETFLQVKDRFPELTSGMSPDLVRMCMRAESETSPEKLPTVKAALNKIRALHSLPAASSTSKIQARLTRRYNSVRTALRTVDVFCDPYGVSDVYGASLVAGSIWNYRQGIGTSDGLSLLRKRFIRFVAK